MFRKLVSNLAFSPSLVEQLGIYSRRLNKEKSIRRLGLVLTVFAIVVQAFMIISPPESTNSVSHNNHAIYDSELTSIISAINNTQNNVDATTLTAVEHDIITYNIAIINDSSSENTDTIGVWLGDILEYADIINYGGGKFDKDEKNLIWNDISLEPGSSTSRHFSISINSPIPSIAQNERSYDCVITNEMSNEINVNINCPPHKSVVEQTILKNLPNFHIAIVMAFWTLLVVIIIFLRLRSRQLGKEIRIIRKRFNSGAL